MDDYISKPLEPKVLFNTLDRWLQTSGLKGEEIAQDLQDYSSEAVLRPTIMEEGLFGESQASIIEKEEPAPDKDAMDLPDAVPVDFDAALYRFGDDRDFMMEMFKEYKDHLPQRLIDIHAALEKGDANGLGRLVHNLKGISLNFSAGRIAKLCLELEELCKKEDLTDAPTLVALLDEQVHRLNEYITNRFS